MSEWQDISTAPKDGTPFLTFSMDAARNETPEGALGTKGTQMLVMAFPILGDNPLPVDECGDWHDIHNWEPTHWMPLPQPPKEPEA